MPLPLKIILPVAGGSVGLAVAIPFATSSSATSHIEKAEQTISSQTIDSTESQQPSLPEPTGAESSAEVTETEYSEVLAKHLAKKCKVIVSEKEQGKLEMCLKDGDNQKVEFTFYQETVASSRPIKVTKLKVTYQNIFLDLEEADEYGNTRVFDLPRSFHGSRSDIAFSGGWARSMEFTQDKCVVEKINSSRGGEKTDWRALCSY